MGGGVVIGDEEEEVLLYFGIIDILQVGLWVCIIQHERFLAQVRAQIMLGGSPIPATPSLLALACSFALAVQVCLFTLPASLVCLNNSLPVWSASLVCFPGLLPWSAILLFSWLFSSECILLAG